MDLNLQRKRVLVTGASAGLGAAAAAALASEGADVTINSRSKERLAKAAERIAEATGVKPAILAGNLADESDLERLCEHVRDARLDILVCNSGGPPAGSLLDHQHQMWDDAADLLLRPAIRLTRSVVEGMIERGYGRLIYITSVAVLQPVDDLILSNTYRAGVTGFCKTVSNNYARFGVTANCVCPGYTATERLTELATTRAKPVGKTAVQVLEELASGVPAGRLGEPEEPASLIAFLASERAAYITGCSLPVDGGANQALV